MGLPQQTKYPTNFFDNKEEDEKIIAVASKDPFLNGYKDISEDELVKMGADYIQGYYYSKPLPKEEFLDYIARENGVAG